MGKRHKIGIGFVLVILALLALDYTAYVRDERWYAQLVADLPMGTHIDQARLYLVDEGDAHGIKGLWEDHRPDMRGFVIRHHNNSIVTRWIVDDFDYVLLYGYVSIRFDDDNHLERIYIHK